MAVTPIPRTRLRSRLPDCLRSREAGLVVKRREEVAVERVPRRLCILDFKGCRTVDGGRFTCPTCLLPAFITPFGLSAMLSTLTPEAQLKCSVVNGRPGIATSTDRSRRSADVKLRRRRESPPYRKVNACSSSRAASLKIEVFGPPSTSAQNWRVAGVDNTGTSGLWYELVK